jgi:hypothetical protein
LGKSIHLNLNLSQQNLKVALNKNIVSSRQTTLLFRLNQTENKKSIQKKKVFDRALSTLLSTGLVSIRLTIISNQQIPNPFFPFKIIFDGFCSKSFFDHFYLVSSTFCRSKIHTILLSDQTHDFNIVKICFKQIIDLSNLKQ